MMRNTFLFGLAVALLGGTVNSTVCAQGAEAPAAAGVIQASEMAIAKAEAEVEKARAAITNGKELLAMIPEDSPLMPDVAQVIEAASENWQIAVESLSGAKQSASKIVTASNESIANDYALLAKVNAGVALSGAKVVQIALSYIEAIATERTESLDIIRTAMQDALASSSQVQFNYERVKALIAQKYASN